MNDVTFPVSANSPKYCAMRSFGARRIRSERDAACSGPPVSGGPLFSGAAERAYLVLGCLIGAAGGPLQAASRTLLIRLAPKDRIAQYFGLFALTGKVTSFIGPLLIGTITAVTASQKAGMALLVVFFVAGLALLTRVRENP